MGTAKVCGARTCTRQTNLAFSAAPMISCRAQKAKGHPWTPRQPHDGLGGWIGCEHGRGGSVGPNLLWCSLPGKIMLADTDSTNILARVQKMGILPAGCVWYCVDDSESSTLGRDRGEWPNVALVLGRLKVCCFLCQTEDGDAFSVKQKMVMRVKKKW